MMSMGTWFFKGKDITMEIIRIQFAMKRILRIVALSLMELDNSHKDSCKINTQPVTAI
jgi:hypothetical protein